MSLLGRRFPNGERQVSGVDLKEPLAEERGRRGRGNAREKEPLQHRICPRNRTRTPGETKARPHTRHKAAAAVCVRPQVGSMSLQKVLDGRRGAGWARGCEPSCGSRAQSLGLLLGLMVVDPPNSRLEWRVKSECVPLCMQTCLRLTRAGRGNTWMNKTHRPFPEAHGPPSPHPTLRHTSNAHSKPPS